MSVRSEPLREEVVSEIRKGLAQKLNLGLSSGLDEVLTLRRELRASNREKVFGKSAQKASDLRQKRQSKHLKVLEEAKARLEEQLAQQFAEYRAMRSQTKEESEHLIQCLRMSINQSFQEMQERHVNALQVLELNLAAETLRAQKRPTSEFQELERIAVILADREEFSAASAIVREARATQAQNQSDKEHDVKLSGEAMRRNMFVQFEKEAAILVERLTQGIAGIKEQEAAQIVIWQKQCSVVVNRQMLTEIHESNRKIRRRDLEASVTSTLTQFVRSIATKYGMNRKLGFDSVGK
jgi:hypothetical protein